jgi:hypothetical protein
MLLPIMLLDNSLGCPLVPAALYRRQRPPRRFVAAAGQGLVPVVFRNHALDKHQMGFAASELVAHVNYMLVEGRLTAEVSDGGAAVQDDLILRGVCAHRLTP